MLNLEKIGKKIAILRKEKQMNQNDLAKNLYVTHQAVSKWEKGKSIPSIEILYEITQLFKVSIDFLLDDSEIRADDYSALLKHYPREVIIRDLLHNDMLTEELEKVFYLLNESERRQIIDKIISQRVKIRFESVWHIFSKKERYYILVIILSKKYKYDMYKLFPVLSDYEQNLVKSNVENGTYTYKLPYKKGVIL